MISHRQFVGKHRASQRALDVRSAPQAMQGSIIKKGVFYTSRQPLSIVEQHTTTKPGKSARAQLHLATSLYPTPNDDDGGYNQHTQTCFTDPLVPQKRGTLQINDEANGAENKTRR